MPEMLASFAVLFCVIATHNFVGAQWTPDLLSAYWELELDLFEGAVPSCDRDIILNSEVLAISAECNNKAADEYDRLGEHRTCFSECKQEIEKVGEPCLVEYIKAVYSLYARTAKAAQEYSDFPSNAVEAFWLDKNAILNQVWDNNWPTTKDDIDFDQLAEMKLDDSENFYEDVCGVDTNTTPTPSSGTSGAATSSATWSIIIIALMCITLLLPAMHFVA